jgi:hypothetical protein
MTLTTSTNPLWQLESPEYYAGFRLNRTELPKNTILIDTKRNQVHAGFDAIPLSCLYPEWAQSCPESLAADCATIIILHGKHSQEFVIAWENMDWEKNALLYKVEPDLLRIYVVNRYPISGDGFWIGVKR